LANANQAGEFLCEMMRTVTTSLPILSRRPEIVVFRAANSLITSPGEKAVVGQRELGLLIELARAAEPARHRRGTGPRVVQAAKQLQASDAVVILAARRTGSLASGVASDCFCGPCSRRTKRPLVLQHRDRRGERLSGGLSGSCPFTRSSNRPSPAIRNLPKHVLTALGSPGSMPTFWLAAEEPRLVPTTQASAISPDDKRAIAAGGSPQTSVPFSPVMPSFGTGPSYGGRLV